ncbi:MAG: GAF domain-containing protein [Deltaproteobacteria bacterium]
MTRSVTKITELATSQEILTARLRLLEYSIDNPLDKILVKTLDEVEALTGSCIGFYHFLGDDQKTLTLQAWSSQTATKFCKAEGSGSHYDISSAGVWVDCIHERRPVIHNNYSTLPHRKGMPEGHAEVIRELVVPVFRGDQIVAILGVGNKPSEFTDHDIQVVSLLADLAWDVAERKLLLEKLHESNQFNQQIINGANEGIVVYDLNLHYQVWNPFMERISGMKAEEVIGRHPLEVFPFLKEAGVVERLKKVLAGESVAPFDFPYHVMQSGKSGWATDSTVPLLDSKGAVIGLIGAVSEISDYKSYEEALVRLNENLEARVAEEVQKNREKDKIMIHQGRMAEMGEMISNIAHQWRQPLNNLALMLQDLDSLNSHGELTPEALHQEVEKAVGVIIYLSHTIDDFRFFFLKDREKSRFSINLAIDKAVNLLTPGLNSHNINISVEASEVIEVVGYANEYSQAVLNIINNARDVLIERKVERPEIAIRILKEDGRSAVTVSDNAGGIDPDIIFRIFEPYFSTKFHAQGTGIGLYMSKTIIEKNMGGEISVSNVKNGAEFKIVL